MGRAPCCDKANVKRGPWSPEEDATLKNYVQTHGIGGNWIALPLKAGLKRCGKSCRLRWLNYLRPDIKHGGFTEEEDNIICTLYSQMGSRWSLIASQLPGRTDNDVKNYWNTKLKRKQLAVAAGKSSSSSSSSSSSFHLDNNNGGFGFLDAQQQQPEPSDSLLSCLPNISTPMLGYGFSVSSTTSQTPVMNFCCPDKITTTHNLSQSGLNLDNSHNNNVVVVSSQEGSSVSDSNTGNRYRDHDTGNINVLMDDIIIDQQLQLNGYDHHHHHHHHHHQFPNYYEFVNGEIVSFDLSEFSDGDNMKPTTTDQGLNQSVVNRY